MNRRLFSFAVMISAIPLIALAKTSSVSFNEGDFKAAKKITRNGDTLISLKLSKSGKAKLKKLNAEAVNKDVHLDVAHVEADFKLREAITGDSLEAGPFASDEADRIVTEINN